MLFFRRVGGVIVLIFMGAGPFLCVKKARQDGWIEIIVKFLLCICFYSGVKDEVCVISGHWFYFIIIIFFGFSTKYWC